MDVKKLDELIEYLKCEEKQYNELPVPDDENEKFRLYRSLVNIRPPRPADESYLQAEEEFLKEVTAEKGITRLSDLEPVEEHIYLWKGDITTLECGAIVNAANSGMTGCWQPCHSCIDNCIHTFAGVRLRYRCAEIMEEQGYDEPTGQAKITPAYDLPCEYVIHTVGPIVSVGVTEKHCNELKSCYQSCLETAVDNGIKSIAFCCISTGVFGFPKFEAAVLAVNTVRSFVKDHDIEVIFNVFTDDDYYSYRELLAKQ